MPRFQGTLEPTELPALVRLLCDVGATGCLRLAGAQRSGELWMDGGRLVAARSGAVRGRAALDAIAYPEGEFVFAGDDDPPQPDADLLAPRAGDPFRRLQAAAARWARLSPLLAARWALTPLAQDVRGEPLTLDREALRALLAVGRGERSLEAIAAGGDLLATAEALRSLRDLGVVQAEGVQAEGVQAEGVQAEGVQAEGVQAEGVQAEGVQAEGVQAEGVQAEGSPQGEQGPAAAAAGEAPPAPADPESAPSGGPRFRPTATWQEVPPGTAVPPGGEYRMELGGRVLARWPNPPPEGESAP